MFVRVTRSIIYAGSVLMLMGGAALAQGTGNHAPMQPVPHHKVTPSHYMKHPRPVPEAQTTETLNQMSLTAAQSGKPFTPPAPGTEHKQ